MKRGVVLATTGAVVLAGAVYAWNAVRQEREYRRLIADGDAALTKDQTYEAIEDFSGALALNNESMLAYLKRGEARVDGGGGLQRLLIERNRMFVFTAKAFCADGAKIAGGRDVLARQPDEALQPSSAEIGAVKRHAGAQQRFT